MSNTESPATVEVQTDPSIVVVEGEDRIHAVSACTVGPPGARGAPGPSAFEQAVEEGFEGTFEEWIDTLRGEDGSPGLSAYEIALQQGFEGTEEEWLDFLRGEPGEDGIDGEEVELRSDGTHIQWKYADEVMWNNLVPLEDLRGPAGNDGREVELQVSETHIQWRHAGDVAWTDLISLESLRGPAGQDGSDGEDGDPGADGKSAYEIALENGFEGNEAEWLASLKGDPGLDGENGREVELQTSATHVQWRYVGDAEWNDLVALASITGPAGSDGTDGDDGADGREVQFQASSTHIQWRYEGESEWTDLIALTSITGPAGADGDDGDPGADGREVELQKGDTSIQWRYVGDNEWNDLVALSEITGPAGDPGSDGLSAYQVWLGLGNAGTEQDFIDALKGEQGDPGDGVESVVRLPIIHLTNLDLSEPHPLGGYLEPNRTMFQLLGQDDPDENGTYATPDDPSTEGIVKVPVGEQILDPSNQHENISKPFVATMMIAGANWWIGAHEFFVGSDLNTGNPVLSYQLGTSTYAVDLIELDETLIYDSNGSLSEGAMLFGHQGNTSEATLYIFTDDVTPLKPWPIQLGHGVGVYIMRTGQLFINMPHSGWLEFPTPTAESIGAVSSVNGITGIWRGSQAEYDLLTPDADVLYFITE